MTTNESDKTISSSSIKLLSDSSLENKISCQHGSNLRLLFRPTLVFLVCSVGEKARKKYLNVAPYSLVIEASHNPPRVLIGVRHDTDTYRNIIQNKEFTLNLCSPSNLEVVRQCARKLPYGTSECDFYEAGLTPFVDVNRRSIVPGLLETPLTFWCSIKDGQRITFSEKCYDNLGKRTFFSRGS